jgi:hypothetical protein
MFWSRTDSSLPLLESQVPGAPREMSRGGLGPNLGPALRQRHHRLAARG